MFFNPGARAQGEDIFEVVAPAGGSVQYSSSSLSAYLKANWGHILVISLQQTCAFFAVEV